MYSQIIMVPIVSIEYSVIEPSVECFTFLSVCSEPSTGSEKSKSTVQINNWVFLCMSQKALHPPFLRKFYPASMPTTSVMPELTSAVHLNLFFSGLQLELHHSVFLLHFLRRL